MELADYANKYETIRIERSDGVLEVTMHSDGGEVKWGVTPSGHHAELGMAFQDIARDTENKIVILTGTGRNFIAERNLGEKMPEDNLSAMWDRMQVESLAMIEGFLAIPVPVICAINGPALIHSEIAVLGDIVLAADHTVFADTTHAPNGVVPGDGTQLIWPILLGANRGRYFLLTGERLTAEQARDLNVAAEIMPLDELMPRARALARQLADKCSRRMLRHTKTLLVRYLRGRIRDEIDLGLGVQGLAMM